MSATGPAVTLTTDFGTPDGYVGAMKGRILSICPEARPIDISHAVEPQSVLQGAWCLRRAVPQFPAGTVHVAVIDPGVGSARRGLVIATDRFLLVGPDNGLLTLAAEQDGVRRAWIIGEAPPRWRKSGTFDGLELFAPVGAHLAAGMRPEEVGPPTTEWTPLPMAPPTIEPGRVRGEVLFFDRFGNAITNIARAMAGGAPPRRIACGEGREVPLVDHYGALADRPGAPGALWNSDGLLELTVYAGSARERLGLAPGVPVELVTAPAGP